MKVTILKIDGHKFTNAVIKKIVTVAKNNDKVKIEVKQYNIRQDLAKLEGVVVILGDDPSDKDLRRSIWPGLRGRVLKLEKTFDKYSYTRSDTLPVGDTTSLKECLEVLRVIVKNNI